MPPPNVLGACGVIPADHAAAQRHHARPREDATAVGISSRCRAASHSSFVEGKRTRGFESDASTTECRLRDAIHERVICRLLIHL